MKQQLRSTKCRLMICVGFSRPLMKPLVISSVHHLVGSRSRPFIVNFWWLTIGSSVRLAKRPLLIVNTASRGCSTRDSQN